LLFLKFSLLNILGQLLELGSVVVVDELLSLNEVAVLLKCFFEIILQLDGARACLLKFGLVVTCRRISGLPFLHTDIQLSQPLRIQLLIFQPFLRR
jgi:hypothetical protein